MRIDEVCPAVFPKLVLHSLKHVLLLALLVASSALRTLSAAESNPGFRQVATVPAPLLDEISGLAPCLTDDKVLWAHNDSGDGPIVYAISSTGAYLGSVKIAGVEAFDWEDMASFTWKGRRLLMLADTGDNMEHRRIKVLRFIYEPDPSKLDPRHPLVVEQAWELRFEAEGAPFDCEAVAVDATAEQILLLTKRRKPNTLLVLPLRIPVAGEILRPEQKGALVGLPVPHGLQGLIAKPTGRYRGQPTGLDISQDGRRAVLLGYGQAFLYERHPDQSWSEVLAQPGKPLPKFKLSQAESICFSSDGKSIFLSSEGRRSPLLKLDLLR